MIQCESAHTLTLSTYKNTIIFYLYEVLQFHIPLYMYHLQ